MNPSNQNVEIFCHAFTADLQEIINSRSPASNIVINRTLTLHKQPGCTGTNAIRKANLDGIIADFKPILHSRCVGLIEVIRDKNDGNRAYLGYTHAIVPEYIKVLQNLGRIPSPPASWSPRAALLMAIISIMKSFVPTQTTLAYFGSTLVFTWPTFEGLFIV